MSECTRQRKVEHKLRHVLGIERTHDSLGPSFNVSVKNCRVVVEAVRNFSDHDMARVTAHKPSIVDEVDGTPTSLNQFEVEFPSDGSGSHRWQRREMGCRRVSWGWC